MPDISDALTPDSITDDTNAANPGAAEPASATVALIAAPTSTTTQQRWIHSRKTGSDASAP